MATWTPANLATQPLVWISGANATFDGANHLTALGEAGSLAGAISVNGTVSKVTMNGLAGVNSTTGGNSLVKSLAWSSATLYAFLVTRQPTLVQCGPAFRTSGWPGASNEGAYYPYDGGGTGAYSTMNGYANTPQLETIGNNGAIANQGMLQELLLGTPNGLWSNCGSVSLNSNDGPGAIPSMTSRVWTFLEDADFELFELLIFAAKPGAADLAKLQGWGAWLYGIQSTALPSGHRFETAAPQIYALAASQTTFGLTGVPVVQRVARKLAAAAGSFVRTGLAARLESARKLPATSGVVTLSGAAANLVKSSAASTYALAAAVGSFIAAGMAASFRRTYALAASFGAFGFTFDHASLRYSDGRFWTPIVAEAESWIPVGAEVGTWTQVPITGGAWT